MKKKKILNFRVDEETHAEFTRLCENDYTTPSQVLCKFVKESVDTMKRRQAYLLKQKR